MSSQIIVAIKYRIINRQAQQRFIIKGEDLLFQLNRLDTAKPRQS